MERSVSRFKALQSGPCYTLLRFTGDVNVGAFNNGYRQYLRRVSGEFFAYQYFWWIAEDDSVYLAVTGNRLAVTILNNYIKCNRGHYFDACEVLHLSRGVITFTNLVSGLFEQRKRTTGHRRSFGGSVQ